MDSFPHARIFDFYFVVHTLCRRQRLAAVAVWAGAGSGITACLAGGAAFAMDAAVAQGRARLAGFADEAAV